MKISQEQLISLWEKSLPVLRVREPKWILETFWVPTVLLLLSVAIDNFNKQTLIKSSIVSGVIFFISAAIYLMIRLLIFEKSKTIN
jgi:hypothetical protein